MIMLQILLSLTCLLLLVIFAAAIFFLYQDLF